MDVYKYSSGYRTGSPVKAESCNQR